MNLVCLLFGHSLRPMVVKQEKTIVNDKENRVKWDSIVICPRCGKSIDRDVDSKE